MSIQSKIISSAILSRSVNLFMSIFLSLYRIQWVEIAMDLARTIEEITNNRSKEKVN